MHRFIASILLFVMSAGTLAAPSAPLPRKSPEFTINEASGKQILLSGFKGKVVVLEFLFLRSRQCLDLLRTLNKLNAELGPQGLQPVAIAFPAPGSDANGPLVGYTVDFFKITFPVGYANKENVDQYLGRGPTDTLRIPQVIVIDRTGMIRAQTGGRNGNLMLENEAYLRTYLNTLLKENPPQSSPTIKAHQSTQNK